MLRNAEVKQPETVRARRPPLPGARWPRRRLARRIALVQRNARQGPPTLWHQRQPVQDPLSLELNRRLVVKSRLSEVFSAVNASVGPPHFFVISSNLTTVNTRTIGSIMTLHRHFHLPPLDPLARKLEGSAEVATCSVAQSKRGWSISPRLSRNPVSVEIRCQFIILARKSGVRNPGGNPVSKSGVSPEWHSD